MKGIERLKRSLGIGSEILADRERAIAELGAAVEGLRKVLNERLPEGILLTNDTHFDQIAAQADRVVGSLKVKGFDRRMISTVIPALGLWRDLSELYMGAFNGRKVVKEWDSVKDRAAPPKLEQLRINLAQIFPPKLQGRPISQE